MKITCLAICLLGFVALATSESGFFVPKAFYKLDAEGHKSNVHEINPHQANILRRLRRESSSSSSSSSTFSHNGGPTYIESHQVVQQSPRFESRFGGDDDEQSYDVYGHAIHSQSIIDANGRVVYHDTKHQKL